MAQNSDIDSVGVFRHQSRYSTEQIAPFSSAWRIDKTSAELVRFYCCQVGAFFVFLWPNRKFTAAMGRVYYILSSICWTASANAFVLLCFSLFIFILSFVLYALIGDGFLPISICMRPRFVVSSVHRNFSKMILRDCLTRLAQNTVN